MISLPESLRWSERLLALATLLQSIELFQLRRSWSDTGVWRWKIIRQDFAGYSAIFRALFDIALGARGFAWLLAARIAAALFLFAAPSAPALAIAFFSTWLIALRWRGTFNGGSDSMTALVALALWIARMFPDSTPVARACLAYIAVQLTASYFIAGLGKLRAREWRDGTALTRFIRLAPYDSPPEWVRRALASRVPAAAAALSVIAFECAFPCAWSGPRACAGFLIAAFAFHLMNFRTFGLNRFVFSWLSAYPALYYWSQPR